jgi:hypothetical protein
VELDEGPEAALIRELHEELGITVEEACLGPFLREFFLPRLPPPYAALSMPALEGFCRRTRKPDAEVGAATGSARPSDAAGRRTHDPGAPRPSWLTSIEYRRRSLARNALKRQRRTLSRHRKAQRVLGLAARWKMGWKFTISPHPKSRRGFGWRFGVDSNRHMILFQPRNPIIGEFG